MSATTITQTPTSPRAQLPPALQRRPRTAYQVWGVFGGSALLALATQLHTSAVATALMIAGFVTVYLNCHALAHYLAGRAVGLRFRGYGVRGTDHPEVYPPGIRQLMQAAPFYVALSTKDSREQASGRAKAIYYAAGETSTAICSIAYAAIAAAANIPGGQLLLVAMIIFNVDLDDRHDPQPYRRLRQGAPRPPQLTTPSDNRVRGPRQSPGPSSRHRHTSGWELAQGLASVRGPQYGIELRVAIPVRGTGAAGLRPFPRRAPARS